MHLRRLRLRSWSLQLQLYVILPYPRASACGATASCLRWGVFTNRIYQKLIPLTASTINMWRTIFDSTPVLNT
jgi:hypothetical protein